MPGLGQRVRVQEGERGLGRIVRAPRALDQYVHSLFSTTAGRLTILRTPRTWPGPPRSSRRRRPLHLRSRPRLEQLDDGGEVALALAQRGAGVVELVQQARRRHGDVVALRHVDGQAEILASQV